ncbi:cell division protein FtsA [Zavarzinia sp. CC-PAN008]|uniref:cell division protein FtsA n=1 Tax=Zavarzinia sp. CC-PAN008 TaxID=3243332 RepID=UPI003F746D16
MAVGRNSLVAALDVGTSKVACFIARFEGGLPRVVGVGQQASRGMRAGTITDMEATEQSIRAAVEAAERMAGETVREVFVNVSGTTIASQSFGVEVGIAGRVIADADLRRVLSQGRAQYRPPDREVLHAIPIGYAIDGARGIRDPRGMYGERLGVDMYVVTAQAGPVRNHSVCVARSHLGIAGMVVSPYAAGLACLVDDEMELGITVIDMGGGTTSIAVFYDRMLVHAAVLGIGGMHVTNDIARGLLTPMADAERMKTLYGSAMPGARDDQETIDVPQVGETDHISPNHVPRSVLNAIIRARVEETFELVAKHLAQAGLQRLGGRKIVLTGGASQLQGTRDLAAQVLGKQVRIGRPIGISGLPEATSGPAFSVCAGLINYAARAPVEALLAGPPAEEPASPGPMRRIGLWLKNNF